MQPFAFGATIIGVAERVFRSGMFLCLYSGGARKQNEAIDSIVVDRVSKKGSITYIPSDSTHPESASFFEYFKSYFGHYGIRRIKYFCHDRPFRAAALKDALTSDAVYLSGGNTFSFCQGLRRSKVESALIAFVKNGGALLGQSAGSILMTPNIATAAVGPVKDPNDVRLKDLRGLNLIDTLFVPHYEPTRGTITELRKFSSLSPGRLMVAAQDGGGIIKSDNTVTLVGPVTLFSGGKVLSTVDG